MFDKDLSLGLTESSKAAPSLGVARCMGLASDQALSVMKLNMNHSVP